MKQVRFVFDGDAFEFRRFLEHNERKYGLKAPQMMIFPSKSTNYDFSLFSFMSVKNSHGKITLLLTYDVKSEEGLPKERCKRCNYFAQEVKVLQTNTICASCGIAVTNILDKLPHRLEDIRLPNHQ